MGEVTRVGRGRRTGADLEVVDWSRFHWIMRSALLHQRQNIENNLPSLSPPPFPPHGAMTCFLLGRLEQKKKNEKALSCLWTLDPWCFMTFQVRKKKNSVLRIFSKQLWTACPKSMRRMSPPLSKMFSREMSRWQMPSAPRSAQGPCARTGHDAPGNRTGKTKSSVGWREGICLEAQRHKMTPRESKHCGS